jgi:hypothetical protein
MVKEPTLIPLAGNAQEIGLHRILRLAEKINIARPATVSFFLSPWVGGRWCPLTPSMLSNAELMGRLDDVLKDRAPSWFDAAARADIIRGYETLIETGLAEKYQLVPHLIEDRGAGGLRWLDTRGPDHRVHILPYGRPANFAYYRIRVVDLRDGGGPFRRSTLAGLNDSPW